MHVYMCIYVSVDCPRWHICEIGQVVASICLGIVVAFIGVEAVAATASVAVVAGARYARRLPSTRIVVDIVTTVSIITTVIIVATVVIDVLIIDSTLRVDIRALPHHSSNVSHTANAAKHARRYTTTTTTTTRIIGHVALRTLRNGF